LDVKPEINKLYYGGKEGKCGKPYDHQLERIELVTLVPE
jgi:hypothetical protein